VGIPESHSRTTHRHPSKGTELSDPPSIIELRVE
jgi:hypothetical protein